MEAETLETLNPDDNGDQPMPDLPPQDPTSSDSDSESDSESDSGDHSAKNLQLQTLEAELSMNPENYDAHVQYIKILRELADIEKLRQAREAMNKLFPLTPCMWQEWAKDEASLSTGSDAFPAIAKLYERGLFEYLSIFLWNDYLYFVQQNDPSVRERSPAGISRARDLFERALTAAGLHVSEGSKLWEAYRDFEQSILHTVDDTNNQSQAREKQIQRIRSIFHRHLSVPHVNMRSTLLAYKKWEVEQGTLLDADSSDLDGISVNVASAHKKALEMYNARLHLEEQICLQDMSDSERLQNFMNYLKFEQSSGDPARVQMLYERAITDFPISSYLWLDYTHYLDKTLKVGCIITNVYARAVKNCPYVGELWVRYLLSLERGHASEKEIAAVFEKSLQLRLSIPEYLDLYLTRIDGLRRRISCPVEGEHVLDYSLIREIFQNASDYLSAYLKNTDGLLRLHAYWARLELNVQKDKDAARGVWESLLKISGAMMEAWEGYIGMEIELGNVNGARSIYRRCYCKKFPGTGSEDICHSWLRFEREFGSLEDFDRAAQKVAPRLEELQLFKSQQESKLTEERENSSKKNARDKRKHVSDDEQYPAKRQKVSAQKPKKAHGEDSEVLKSVEQNKAEKAKAKGDKPDLENEQKMKEHVPEKRKVFADQCTAFVSNINLKANDEDLRQFFSDVGGVVAIRLLHDKFSGKSRGLAYVDFSDDAHLVAAVGKSKQMLLGKKLSIARSNPKQGKKENAMGSKLKDSAETSNGPKGGRQAIQSTHNRGSDNVQLRGKNTFATPRNILALGRTANKPKSEEQDDEKPKSNDEFRNMFMKG